MRLFFLITALFCINSINAQQKDSVLTISDTLVQKQKLSLNETFSKTNGQNLKIRSLVIPGTLIAYGFVALNNRGLRNLNISTKLEIREDHPKFITKIDNYLQYSPAVAVYGLNAIGIKGKNNFRDRTMIYTLSAVISAAFVLPLKKITKIQRPDGSGFNSFPSGHTTTAFASAEFLWQEYKDVSPWYGIAGYAAAATTGLLRLYNNKHWLNDVVAGAGFGILSTKLAYWIYPAIKKRLFKDRPMNAMVMPYYQESGGGLAFVYHFSH